MWSSPFIWTVIAIALFWAVGAYNRLVRLRAAVLQAFGSLDAHLVQWLAMLGEFDAVQVSENTLDRETPGTLQGAITQLIASLAVARARPLHADALAALSAACAVVDAVWWNLQLYADADDISRKMASWGARWDELHNHNEQAIRIFNEAVLCYNAAIGQFPAALLAWVFGFTPAGALNIAREANL